MAWKGQKRPKLNRPDLSGWPWSRWTCLEEGKWPLNTPLTWHISWADSSAWHTARTNFPLSAWDGMQPPRALLHPATAWAPLLLLLLMSVTLKCYYGSEVIPSQTQTPEQPPAGTRLPHSQHPEEGPGSAPPLVPHQTSTEGKETSSKGWASQGKGKGKWCGQPETRQNLVS